MEEEQLDPNTFGIITLLQPRHIHNDSSVFITTFAERGCFLNMRTQLSTMSTFLVWTLKFNIGLGAIWRFPMNAYMFGTGSFLTAYIICMLVIVYPLYLLEVSLGQIKTSGPMEAFTLCPLLEGIGSSMSLMCVILPLYQNVLVAYGIFFMFPGEHHHHHVKYSNGTDKNFWDELRVWKYGIEMKDAKNYRWMLIGCVLSSFIISYLLHLTMRRSTKFGYILISLPYISFVGGLLALFKRKGAYDGLKYFFTLNTSLMDTNVWYYALEQAMYSVGVALGPLIMFGSYACVRRDVRFNIILSCVLVIILSVLASMFVFEILGIKASASDESIANFTHTGPHFVFVVYSEAFNLIAAAPNITRALFYFVFVTTAASNSFTTIIVVVSSIDKFAPKLCHKIGYNNTYFIVMGVMFMLSITCVTKDGMSIIQVLDTIPVGMSLIPLAMFELIAVIYIYGVDSFMNDLLFLRNIPTNHIYPLIWIISPIIFLVATVYSWRVLDWTKYSIEILVPGLALWLLVMAPIPLMAIYNIIKFYKAGRPIGVLEAFKRVKELPQGLNIDNLTTDDLFLHAFNGNRDSHGETWLTQHETLF